MFCKHHLQHTWSQFRNRQTRARRLTHLFSLAWKPFQPPRPPLFKLPGRPQRHSVRLLKHYCEHHLFCPWFTAEFDLNVALSLWKDNEMAPEVFSSLTVAERFPTLFLLHSVSFFSLPDQFCLLLKLPCRNFQKINWQTFNMAVENFSNKGPRDRGYYYRVIHQNDGD